MPVIMSAQMKLYTLAALYAPLVAVLTGSVPPYIPSVPTFRWADKQVAQDWFPSTITPDNAVAAVTVLLVSDPPGYIQGGIIPLETPRFQLDVRHPYAETARQVADAVTQFLGTFDLTTITDFTVYPTPPVQCRNFVLNRRERMDYQLKPPVHVVSLDVRMFNRTDL